MPPPSQPTKVPYLTRRPVVPSDVPASRTGRISNEIPDMKNVQGDVYYMFPKACYPSTRQLRWERFVFFSITNVDQFRQALDTYHPRVTNSEKTKQDLRTIDARPGGNLNITSNAIGFNKAGLRRLDIRERLGDPHFDQGSLVKERDLLGDMAEYDKAFATDGANHGVFIICAGTQGHCLAEWDTIKNIFANSINEITNLEGHVRSGDGEFFGWRDGISQPALENLGEARPGQRVIKPGVIIMGYPGDPAIDDPRTLARPSWTKDGSFMVFRFLEQNVLFFEDYIEENWRSIPASEPGDGTYLTEGERKKLFGARMVGRFKSGVPLALSPYREDTKYLDPKLIDNFNYSETHGRCPFSAHIRKTVPRDLGPYLTKEYLDSSMILRAGIPYGPEITSEERVAWRQNTLRDKIYATSPRGLLFACYQSSIHNGFFRQTTEFANNDFFPPTSLLPKNIGQDPIIGGPKADKTPLRITNDAGDVVVTSEEAQTFYSEEFKPPKTAKGQTDRFDVFMK
ncbi:hypothetical protein H0H92_015934, partial [Tricholoma furcatifolium]